MTVLYQFVEAMIGWAALALRQPDWRRRFVLDREGLIAALGAYFAAVIIALLVQRLVFGIPSLPDLALGVLVNGLPVLGILIAIVGTTRFLGTNGSILEMLVPAVHALTALLILGFVVTYLGGGPLSSVLLALMGYLLYRGAREILGLGVGSAFAFAALSILLLVALPLSLYMLLAPGPGGPI